ncbi:hypothetical protein OPV22_015216 [Ensete ventricosum]|uniref:Metalloenzyme domain-containing protein n=1 Tax=Ensete ventricosum TaxID=4639 RepID=A0AAV8RCH7_ENSVE|nr:hypothetical protein OPV22_015216 [Ensete ventricosum]
MFSFSLSSEILLCADHGNTQQRCVCHGKSESLSQLQYFNGLQTDGYLLGFQKAALVVFWVSISKCCTFRKVVQNQTGKFFSD